MTCNSFTSVSLDPVLVLFCAEKVARFHDVVLATGQWAVSVLAQGQEDVSRHFALRGRSLEDQFAGTAAHARRARPARRSRRRARGAGVPDRVDDRRRRPHRRHRRGARASACRTRRATRCCGSRAATGRSGRTASRCPVVAASCCCPLPPSSASARSAPASPSPPPTATVPRGTKVRAVDIGGLSRADAVGRAVRRASRPSAPPRSSLVAGDDVLQLDPAAAGLDLDADGDRRRGARRRAARPAAPRWSAPAATSSRCPPSTTPRSTRRCAALAEGVDREPREGSSALRRGRRRREELPVTGRTPRRRRRRRGASSRSASRCASRCRSRPSRSRRPPRTSRPRVREIAEPAVVRARHRRGRGRPGRRPAGGRRRGPDGRGGRAASSMPAARRRRRCATASAAGSTRSASPPVDATFDTSSGTPVVVPSQDRR